MNPGINYWLIIPDHDCDEFTPFQGFSPGLMNFEWALHQIAILPSDLLEPALPRDAVVARRRAGMGGYRWSPMNVDVLPQLRFDGSDPLWVFFSQDPEVAGWIQAWLTDDGIEALHVRHVDSDGFHRLGLFDRGVYQAFERGGTFDRPRAPCR